MQRLRFLWFIAIAVASVTILLTFLWRLNVLPIQNWDESIHAEVSREMVRSGNWLDLTYRDGHYFRKPPLSFWLRSFAFRAFGENPWTVRGWSALAGALTTALLTLWAWQLWRKRWQALLAAVVFATGPFVFFHAFRTGESDGLLVFFVTLALYAGWRGKLHGRWLWLAGAAVGLSVMTKSASGLLPIPILLLDALLTRSWPYKWRDVFVAIGIVLAIVVPWHAIEYTRFGSQFFKDYIGLHVIERATEQIHNQGVGTFWYVSIFFKRFFPWSAFFPFAFLCAGWQWWRNRRSSWALPFAWFIVVFVFFTIVRTKFDWYILPLYPAAALIVAPWLATLLQQPSKRIALAQGIGVVGYFALLPRILHPDSVLRWTIPWSYLTGLGLNAAYGAVVLVIASLAVWLLISKRQLVSTITGGLMLTHLLLMSVGLSLLTIRSEKDNSPLPAVVAAVRAAGPQQPVQVIVQLHVKGVDLIHYPAAYWYFNGIPGMSLNDWEQSHNTFGGPFDLMIVRDPADPPVTWPAREVERIADFRIFRRQ